MHNHSNLLYRLVAQRRSVRQPKAFSVLKEFRTFRVPSMGTRNADSISGLEWKARGHDREGQLVLRKLLAIVPTHEVIRKF